ncbi:multidrug transporter CflA [Aurantimonas sp. Leaf443]|nr:multidrug transporter CflA [Aurantimonas sp. Leaf443]
MTERRTGLVGGLLVAIGPVSMALYTPAMPALVVAIDTTPGIVKLTLAIYFAGFAITQLVCGPVSDAFGRRPATIAFMLLYMVGALAAMVAPTVEILLAARLLQGCGASIGLATARAIVRDQFTGEQSSRILNTIGIVLALGPAVSPTIGGIVLDLAGWGAIFVAMVVFGIGVILVTLLVMRETVVPDRSRIAPRQIGRAYATLLTHPHFVTSSLTVAGAVGTLYALATMLPFVLIDRAGLTPTQFGIGMLAQSGSFFFGSIAGKLAMRRVGARALVAPGLALIALGSLGLVVSIALLPVSYASIMVPVGFYAFGIALVMPAMTTAALAPFPTMAGAAAAMTGFIQMGAGLLGGLAAAAIGEPVLATQTVIPCLGAISIGAYLVHRRLPPPSPAERRAGSETAPAAAG